MHLSRRTGLLIAAMAGLLAGATEAAHAQRLIADVSQRRVEITTGFTGAEILLFGATGGVGDVVMIVHGPYAPTIVRRKERVLGIWVNRTQVTFEETPAFYRVAASGDLAEFDIETLLSTYGIAHDYRNFGPASSSAPPEDLTAFRDALVRLKQETGLYSTQPGEIIFIGERLFRTTVHFPANVPVGTYRVEVFNVSEGHVLNATASVLVVNKAGFGATVYDFARDHGAAYGVVAIIVALMAGWAAGAVFRKV